MAWTGARVGEVAFAVATLCRMPALSALWVRRVETGPHDAVLPGASVVFSQENPVIPSAGSSMLTPRRFVVPVFVTVKV